MKKSYSYKVDENMRKALMIIAQEGFRDEELLHPKEELEKGGVTVKIASKTKDIAKGMKGTTLTPDISLKDVRVNEYDAIIFVGGIGAKTYFNDKKALEIVRESVEKNKILGAICIAPCILANAGVLKDRNATVFNIPFIKKYVKILEKNGANFQKKNVVVDNNIVTANGPAAAREFGKTILNMIKEQ
jgi:protease I